MDSMDGIVRGRKNGSVPARPPKDAYTIRGNRIVRAKKGGPTSPATAGVQPGTTKGTNKNVKKGVNKGTTKAVGAKPTTPAVKGVINIKYVTIGLVLGLVGLSVLAMAMNGGSSKTPATTQSAEKIGDEQTNFTVEDGPKQPASNTDKVLGASDQAAPVVQPTTSQTASRTNRTLVKTSPSSPSSAATDSPTQESNPAPSTATPETESEPEAATPPPTPASPPSGDGDSVDPAPPGDGSVPVEPQLTD